MKKTVLKLLVLVTALALLSGCAKTEQDPYKHYRKYNSTELFEQGEKALSKKHYEQACKYLEAIDALYPFSANTEQAKLDIIYAYYKNGDSASSITAAERFCRVYPRSEHVDYAYYMRGIVNFTMGQTWLQRGVGIDPGSRDLDNLQQSYKAFSELQEQFPHSYYAPDARVRMVYVRNLLAQREFNTAQFYYERQAYVAATNRASRILQHYEGAPVTEKALGLLMRSYRKLGLMDMAHATEQLLRVNYPNSSELSSIAR